jgi:hypothetical protein
MTEGELKCEHDWPEFDVIGETEADRNIEWNEASKQDRSAFVWKAQRRPWKTVQTHLGDLSPCVQGNDSIVMESRRGYRLAEWIALD